MKKTVRVIVTLVILLLSILAILVILPAEDVKDDTNDTQINVKETEFSSGQETTEEDIAEQEIAEEDIAEQEEIPEAKPEEYDLPIHELPEPVLDITGIGLIKYETMPIFKTQNEVSKFALNQFLNSKTEFECYLDRELAIDEATGYKILDNACEAAMTYYLFGAYTDYDKYAEDRGDEEGFYAKVKLIYTNPEYDLEARAEALEFVMKNPVPYGGFKNFSSEMAYAKRIHDFIARKVIYSAIGYDVEAMRGMAAYEALQEAYNVLGEGSEEAVCAGYARAFALIAHYAGINAAWVKGNDTGTESHAWNVIYPCDGSEPVLVDVTWDDALSQDIVGQTNVNDDYFYIPLAEENEHKAIDCVDDFLKFINER